jgi:probable HAF family extracellular repeat protein
MWWNDCWQTLTGAARRRRRYAPPAQRCVPRLETLEDRSVPSAGYAFATLPQPPSTGTVPVQGAFGINAAGDIAGEYLDANFVSHGYLYSHGQYTTLDDPLAGTAPGQGTFAGGVNARGDVVGQYVDTNSVQHGFVLSDGGYTTLDDPNAGTGPYQGTFALHNNDSGQIVGGYVDANGGLHGFLFSGGQYTTLDDPLAGPGGGTEAYGINNAGQIVGRFSNADGSVSGGFLLSHGQYTTLDVPNGLYTTASGINDRGQIVGLYYDASFNGHGFVLTNGQYTTVDDPDAANTPFGYISLAFGINDRGQVVGEFYDANAVPHSFVATPAPGNSAGSAGGAADHASLVAVAAPAPVAHPGAPLSGEASWKGPAVDALFTDLARASQTAGSATYGDTASSHTAGQAPPSLPRATDRVAPPAVVVPGDLTAALSRRAHHALADDGGTDY